MINSIFKIGQWLDRNKTQFKIDLVDSNNKLKILSVIRLKDSQTFYIDDSVHFPLEDYYASGTISMFDNNCIHINISYIKMDPETFKPSICIKVCSINDITQYGDETIVNSILEKLRI